MVVTSSRPKRRTSTGDVFPSTLPCRGFKHFGPYLNADISYCVLASLPRGGNQISIFPGAEY
jgi:hypothetical protein